ncbi:MAG: alpha/beta hydrolase [Deltaproteobacteria bacterium]|nr:MAG: alpha/beta hydrolase [Deltaproteobacteria bacterium]
MFLGIPTITWAFLAVSLIGAVFTANAFVPVRRVPALFMPSFFGSWLTAELAIHHVFWQSIATLVFVELGALTAWPGWAGLIITFGSWLGLLVLFADGNRARKTLQASLAGLRAPPKTRRVPRRQVVLPFSSKRRRGVKVTRDIVYRRVAGTVLKLDVVAPADGGAGRPAIMQIHGGSWVMGDKGEQGWPLMSHLAANGWVCFNLNYRLSPGATFPDHLIDLKAGLAWIREHADEWGIDPDFIAVTGGSAGGHLAALMALTANDPEYQPGFEEADTSLQAAVPLYGVYDFTSRLGVNRLPFWYRRLESLIMKAFRDEEPEVFRRASPIDRIHSEAPPFFVIHGDRDTLAPVEEARYFADQLRDISNEPVIYAELGGAQHAFDLFCSPRTSHMLVAVLKFLDATHATALPEQQETAAQDPLYERHVAVSV